MNPFQERYKLIAILFIQLSVSSFAQTTNWYAKIDLGKQGIVKAVDADADGNTYVSGEYHDEIRFNSADTSGLSIHGTGSENWSNSYLCKYDNKGNLSYLVRPTNTHQNNTTYVSYLKCLKNGNVAWFLSVPRDCKIKDTKGEVELLSKGKRLLLILNPNGEVIQEVNCGQFNVTKVEEDEEGRLYLLGYTKNPHLYEAIEHEIYQCDLEIGRLIQLNFDANNVVDILFHDKDLWLLEEQRGRRQQYQFETEYSVKKYNSSFADTVRTLYKKRIGLTNYRARNLVVSGGEIFFCISLKVNNITPVTVDEELFKKEKLENALFIFDATGKLHQFHTVTDYSFSRSILGTEDGGFILRTGVNSTLNHNGELIYTVKDKIGFMQEEVLIKVDREGKRQWFLSTFGRCENYNQANIVLKGNQLYVHSNLSVYGDYDFGYVDNDWGASLFVWSVSL